MKFLIHLALVLTSTFSQASEPWLAKISSIYIDSQTQKPKKVEGTGFLVACINCPNRTTDSLIRYFIFTASHVSQGENLKIEMEDANVRIVGRLSDNLHDVEIFEVTSDTALISHTLATYVKPEQKVVGAHRWHHADGRLFLTGAARDRYDFTYKKSPFRFLKPNVFFVDQAREPFTENSFVPVPAWVTGKLVEPPPGKNYAIGHVLFGNESIASSSIANGMSGSPLIRSYDMSINANMVIDGIVSRKLRGFDQTYFVRNEQMDDLFKKYIAGSRGDLKSASWLLNRGITYREFADGTRELVNISTPTGNGLSSDGGNGLSSDGGEGLFDNLINEPMGMIWKGDHVAGFNVSCVHSGKAYEFSIYANLAVLDFFEKFKDLCQSKPIKPSELNRDLLAKAGLDKNINLAPLVQGKNEIIDIHELFFVDLSMLVVPMEKSVIYDHALILETIANKFLSPSVRRRQLTE